ncbi:hypothetical protein [Streptomyces sp. NPDC102437]|uniref:hypothetical protein n=1 Tax=Streptomyces sp. NPDC102437 TaxID=3366175 RepID=UPI00382FB9CB
MAVPMVDRGSAPNRFWSTVTTAERLRILSTSGRTVCGSSPWTKVGWVSLSRRWDSAAMVPSTSEFLPEPETPVKTVSAPLRTSIETSRRLLVRAPRTSM